MKALGLCIGLAGMVAFSATGIPKKDVTDSFRKGVIYGRQAEYAKGVREFSKVIRMKPGDSRAVYNRGVLLCMSGDKMGALKDFSRAVELKPDYFMDGSIVGLLNLS